MKQQINEIMLRIEKLGLKEHEYTQILSRLNDGELALLEQLNTLYRLTETELERLLELVKKINRQLQETFCQAKPTNTSQSFPFILAAY